MKPVFFSGTVIFAACAQAMAPTPNTDEQPFVLTPTTHVCVSATVDDDIPRINHAAFTDDEYTNSFGAEIVAILERRPGRADVVRQFGLRPRTWPAGCKAAAEPVFVAIHYGLNARGKPFAVNWSISQGFKKIADAAERDIDQEALDGKIKRYAGESLIETTLSADMRMRAAEVASLIR